MYAYKKKSMNCAIKRKLERIMKIELSENVKKIIIMIKKNY